MYVAWGGTVGCSQGLKWQEMLCSLQWQNQRSGKCLGREKTGFNCVCIEFSLREWNVFI